MQMVVKLSSDYTSQLVGKMDAETKGGIYSSAPFNIHNELWTQTELKQKMQNYSKITDIDEKSENSFFKSIQGFLAFGKIIGALPISGVFGSSWRKLSYRKTSITALISFGIAAVCFFNAALSVIATFRASKRNALEIANSLRPSVFAVYGTFIYIYFLRYGQQFLTILNKFSSSIVTFCKQDVALKRDAFIISGLIMTSGILENFVLHLEFFTYFDKDNGKDWNSKHPNLSWLETYYLRGHGHWNHILGYNPFWAILGFIQHKWNLYSINYMDAMIAVFARALYFKFKSLCKESEVKLLNKKDESGNSAKSIQHLCSEQSAWTQAVRDHQDLYKLLSCLEEFFSPLVFTSYAINMYYICVQLFDGLTNDAVTRSIVHSIYTPWSFIHLVIRTFIVSICCARINVYAHKFGEILRQCPIEIYSSEISRLDKRIAGGPAIGLTGLGCFTVTKHCMLSILSVVFTFEIVLLQANPSSSGITRTC